MTLKKFVRIYYQSKSLQTTILSLIKIFQSIASANGFMKKVQPQSQEFFLFSTKTLQIVASDFFGISSLSDQDILFLISIAFTLLFTFLIIGLSKGFYTQILCIFGTVPFLSIGFGLGFFPSYLSLILISIPIFLFVVGLIGDITVSKINEKLKERIGKCQKVGFQILKYILIFFSAPFYFINYSIEAMFGWSFSKSSKTLRKVLRTLSYSDFPIVNTLLAFVNAFSIAMLALFFILHDIPVLFFSEWIIMGIVLVILVAFLFTKRPKRNDGEPASVNLRSIDINMIDTKTDSPKVEPRFEEYIKNLVVDIYFLIAQMLVQMTTNLIFDAMETGLNWTVLVFSVLFSLISPLIFMTIFVDHTEELKRRLWPDEYQFYLDNSGSITADLVKTIKFRCEWFPVFELGLRLIYSVATNYRWSVQWVSPLIGMIIMGFFLLVILSVAPFRYLSMMITFAGEAIVLLIVNIVAFMFTTGKINSDYFTDGAQIVVYVIIVLPTIISLICFIFDYPRIEAHVEKPGLRKGWNVNPNLICKNLDGRILEYLSILCGLVNIVGMTLFYAMMPVLGDFQYEGMNIL